MKQSLSGRRVLVTGAAGFIGSHLVRAALAAGASVRAAAGPRGDAGRPTDAPVPLEPFDLTDPQAPARLLAADPPDILIHAAAYGVDPARQDPAAAFNVNVAGTWSLLQASAAAKVERFVFLGSCFEYAPGKGALSEEAAVAPSSVYAATKAAATLLAAHAPRSLGIRSVALRLFGVWGPGESLERLAPQLVLGCAQGRRVPLTAGLQVRDFTYVKDMAERVIRVAGHPDFDRHPVLNVGSGEGRSVREFAGELAAALGGRKLLDFGALPTREGEYPRLVADVSRLKALIGPLRKTSIRNGAREMREAMAERDARP